MNHINDAPNYIKAQSYKNSRTIMLTPTQQKIHNNKQREIGRIYKNQNKNGDMQIKSKP